MLVVNVVEDGKVDGSFEYDIEGCLYLLGYDKSIMDSSGSVFGSVDGDSSGFDIYINIYE